MAALLQSNRRAWKSSFLGCFDYRDAKGSCNWCPFFIPMSVCGTCCAIGRIETIVNDEKPICCDMGPCGICSCFLSNALLGPPGYMLYNCCLRDRVVKKYGIDRDDTVCFKVCYPCSYYQMLISVKEFKAEEEAAIQNGIAR